jgi:hypothetical protein
MGQIRLGKRRYLLTLAIADAFVICSPLAMEGTMKNRARIAFTGSLALLGAACGSPQGPAGQQGKAPTFLVAALKDPKTGNLDRIQIIKGWVDKAGKPQEKIFDVVWGDAARRRIVNGKLTPVGSTLDRLRCRLFQGEDGGQRADGHAGAGLHLAHLVHAEVMGD